jgi:hypothetical protein
VRYATLSLPQTFHIGDRVRMIRKANRLTKGLSGTVVRVVATTTDSALYRLKLIHGLASSILAI